MEFAKVKKIIGDNFPVLFNDKKFVSSCRLIYWILNIMEETQRPMRAGEIAQMSGHLHSYQRVSAYLNKLAKCGVVQKQKVRTGSKIMLSRFDLRKRMNVPWEKDEEITVFSLAV